MPDFSVNFTITVPGKPRRRGARRITASSAEDAVARIRAMGPGYKVEDVWQRMYFIRKG